MTFLLYTALPLTNQARAYTPSEYTDIAKARADFIEQHTPILVCPVNGDDYQREQIETAQCEQQEGADYWMNQED